jgi:hypothetical protein
MYMTSSKICVEINSEGTFIFSFTCVFTSFYTTTGKSFSEALILASTMRKIWMIFDIEN